jgi:hypothetical protein
MSKFNFSNFEEILNSDHGEPTITSEISNQEIKKNMPTFTSDKLCQIIVAYRYLKYNKELAVFAMEELSNRRLNGDIFDFESYIEATLKELPPLSFTLPDFRTVFSQYKNFIK